MSQRAFGSEGERPAKILDYFVLDVFTRTPLEGNPLAVVLNPGDLTTERMQAIARETNLSETTFVERRDPEVERAEGVLVRIFTTEEELPFAGHPTLGTSSLLSVIAPEAMADGTIQLALKVGPVPVRIAPSQSGAEAWPIQGEMTQGDPQFGDILDPRQVAFLTGLSVEDFDLSLPIQVVSTGTAFAIVPLRSADSLRRLALRQGEAASFLRDHGARWFYLLGPETYKAGAAVGSLSSSEVYPRWQARMQFNGGEDPATGSAAGCAISHLVHAGAVASGQTIHLRQGLAIHRPSDLYLSARQRNARQRSPQELPDQNPSGGDITDVRVGGSTILVAKGQLFLP